MACIRFLNRFLIGFALLCVICGQIDRVNAAAAAQDEESDSLIKNNKLLSVERDSAEIDLSTSENEREDEGEEENEPSSESDQQDSKQETRSKTFNWKYHQDDHGHYAGRSLISTEAIHQRTKIKGEGEDELDDDVEMNKINSELKAKKRIDYDQLDPLETIDFAEKEWQLMFRSFDLAYDSISSSIIQEIGKQTNLFDEIVGRLPPKCRRDINHIRDSVRKHKLWALRMLDSNGKLPSGITYGRFSSPGDYEECLAVQVDETLYKDVVKNVTEKYKFHGKYCLIDFRLPMPERPQNKLLSVHESVLNFTGTELGKQYPELIGNYSAYASAFYEVGYLHAFCMPSSCDVNDLTKAMGKAIEGTYIIVNNTIDCEERPLDEPEPLRNSQILSLFLMIVLFLNAFFASFAYYLLNKKPKNGKSKTQPRSSTDPDKRLQVSNHHSSRMGKVHLHEDRGGSSLWDSIMNVTLRSRFYSDCFSIQKNFERLTKPDPRGLTFVHYTRLVAMALTVITHTGALGTLQAITKPADASNSEQIFRDFIPQMLANAFTSIQIFFFMAGFMLVISTFPSVVRDKGHIDFLEYAIKRAIRLMPGIAATICLNFLWPLLVEGPMLKYFIRMIVVPCEVNWWHTMGFVSNFDHVEKMCLRHSYFSASDYQLHIIAFPVLLLLYKQPTLGLFMAALLTVSGFVAQVIMILTKTVLPFMMVDYIDKQAFFNVVHYIHHPVWNHMSAFFYGFIVGYLVVKQIRYNLSPKTIKWLWYILVPAGLLSIFAPYFWNHYKRPIYKWQMVLYVIFDRSILLTCCAWLSYASMVLARKPPAKSAGLQRPRVAQPPVGEQPSKKVGAEIATFEQSNKPVIAISSESPMQTSSLSSPPGLPRQRSSPNLASIMQQHQPQPLQAEVSSLVASPRRLSKAMSSSNLATIVETGNNQGVKTGEQATSGGANPASDQPRQQQPAQQRRSPPPVSNINTLCLVLSRLTFQLYLFNMVVLWVDVNHSKYYWFFSYYFIIFKGAAVYICSAIMAMIFFVVLESPCLTLYIAWVKSRAASRAKRQQLSRLATESETRKQELPLGKQTASPLNKFGVFQSDTLSPGVGGGKDKPTFSFIDLSSSPTSDGPQVDSTGTRRRQVDIVNQTRM